MEIGTIPAEEVAQISGGILSDPIVVRINRLIYEYDQVLTCGPVFPHEVVGFSGGNKYLFPGISGKEMIDHTHWLGALLGSRNIIGTHHTPVRAMIDRAAGFVRAPVGWLALFVAYHGVSRIFFGAERGDWQSAWLLLSEIIIEWTKPSYRGI